MGNATEGGAAPVAVAVGVAIAVVVESVGFIAVQKLLDDLEVVLLPIAAYGRNQTILINDGMRGVSHNRRASGFQRPSVRLMWKTLTRANLHNSAINRKRSHS